MTEVDFTGHVAMEQKLPFGHLKNLVKVDTGQTGMH